MAQFVNRIELFGGTPFEGVYRPLPDAVQDRVIGFSPNGHWLAYFAGNTRLDQPIELHLLAVDGASLHREIPPLLPGQSGSAVGTWASARWVGDDLMIVRVHADDANYRNIIFATLDPFAAEWRHDFSTLIPDYYSGTAFAVSPDGTRVVYITRDSVLVLRDLVAKRDLWRLEDYFNRSVTLGTDLPDVAIPWSRDGQWFAFADERTGQTRRVDRDGHNDVVVADVLMQELSWSPTGSYLAGQVDGELVVYDTDRQQRLGQCLVGTVNRLNNAWSPDGRYLAYRRESWPGPQVVIDVWDLATGAVTRVATAGLPDALLVGWSSQPQWLVTPR